MEGRSRQDPSPARAGALETERRKNPARSGRDDNKVLRRQNLTEDESEEGAAYLQRFATTIAEIDGHFLGVREAFVLSRELGLTAYDCVYFELARHESLPLASLNKALRAVASKRGIPAL
jgi:predicted nucleic acid-binding protein